MIQTQVISGGMASLPAPEALQDNQAALIENMKLSEGGSWQSVNAPDLAHATAFVGALKVWKWSPVHLPADCYDSYVFLAAMESSLVMIYRTNSTTWTSETVQTGVVGSKVRAAQDGTQFVFVDGRAGSRAKRLVIDEDGDIICSDIGVRPSTTKPVIESLEINKDAEGEGINSPIGSVLMYCYCIINQFGERSNPSPVAVMSHHNEYIRGEFIDGTYEYDSALRGSVKSVSVQCSIPYPDECVRVELYRSECDYIEGYTNPTEMTLCASASYIPGLGSEVVTILDAKPRSVQAADYENDLAPTGDDIALSSGVVYIANAITQADFPVKAQRAWKILLTNNNEYAYINQWHRILLYGDTKGKVIDPSDDGLGVDWADITGDIGFYDSDRITLLEAELADPATSDTLTEWNTGMTSMNTAVKIERMYYLKIPVIPAFSEKVIYLVEAENGETISPAPGEFDPTTRILNPVRRPNTALAFRMAAYDAFVTGTAVNGLMPAGMNKANRHMTDRESERPAQGDVVDFDFYYHDGAEKKTIEDLIGLDVGLWGETDDDYWWFDLGDHDINSGGFACVALETVVTTSIAYPPRILRIGDDNTFISIYYYRSAQYASCIVKIQHPTNEYNYAHARCAVDNAFGPYAFLYVSWGKPYYNELGKLTTPLLCGIFQQDSGDDILVGGHSTEWLDTTKDAYVDTINNPHCRVSTAMDDTKIEITDYDTPASTVLSPCEEKVGYPQTCVSQFYVEIGKYIDDPKQALNYMLQRPVYPNEGIGYCGDYDNYALPGTIYGKNVNVSISPINLTVSDLPGRIRWSRGAGVPELHEIQTYNDILRIYPMKSFMPTDEHNTLLVWTASGALLRVNLIDDAQSIASVITEQENAFLTDPDALVQMHDGIVWNDQNGLMYLTQSGTRDIIAFRLARNANRRLVSNPTGEELYSLTSGEIAAYSARYDTWVKIDLGMIPIACFVHDGAVHMVDSDGALWKLNGSTPLPSKIITRSFPARNRIRRIWVFGDHGAAVSVKALVHHRRQVNETVETEEYNVNVNEAAALPGLRADYVQFEITDIENFKSIGIDDGN